MYEFEDRLEGFFNQMLKVFLDLLCSLDIKHIHKRTANAVHILWLIHLLVFYFLLNKPHVSAHTADPIVELHASIHLEDSVGVRTNSNIKNHCIFGLELLAESIEKPVMR